MKFEKVYSDWSIDKELIGYKLGDLYLLKNYCWGNKYDWVISKEIFIHIGSFEFGRFLDEGKIILVNSCKEGKELLLKSFQSKDKLLG